MQAVCLQLSSLLVPQQISVWFIMGICLLFCCCLQQMPCTQRDFFIFSRTYNRQNYPLALFPKAHYQAFLRGSYFHLNYFQSSAIALSSLNDGKLVKDYRCQGHEITCVCNPIFIMYDLYS